MKEEIDLKSNGIFSRFWFAPSVRNPIEVTELDRLYLKKYFELFQAVINV